MSDFTQIDSRDSYSNRFQVKSRKSGSIRSFSTYNSALKGNSDYDRDRKKSSYNRNKSNIKSRFIHSTNRVVVDGDINYKSDKTPNSKFGNLKVDNSSKKLISEVVDNKLNSRNDSYKQSINNINFTDHKNASNLNNTFNKDSFAVADTNNSKTNSVSNNLHNSSKIIDANNFLSSKIPYKNNINEHNNHNNLVSNNLNSHNKVEDEVLDSTFPDKTNKIKKIQNNKNDRINIQVKNMPNENVDSDLNNYFDNKGNVNVNNNNIISRKLTILKPTSYSSVEQIANALKNKHALVLCLKFANSENFRRILDFSFGAASVTNYNVNLEGTQTYVFTIEYDLTQHEKLKCIKEGIVLKER